MEHESGESTEKVDVTDARRVESAIERLQRGWGRKETRLAAEITPNERDWPWLQRRFSDLVSLTRRTDDDVVWHALSS